MHIGIIVHSHSGTTWQAANSLREGLEAAGHQVTLARIKTLPDYRPAAPVGTLAAAPSASGFDALVLASPINAFTLGTAMQAWIRQTNFPPNIRVAAFVNMGFPFASWGGKQALRKLEALCLERGTTVGLTRVINWHTGRRAAQVAEMVRAVAGYFSTNGA